jgi:scyllo-inositol 2-dehydrogenase (NADP+)
MDSGLIEAVHARFNGDALRPLGVAIAGLGRSGWNIHAKTLVQMPRVYRIAAAMDPDGERRAQAGEEFGCAVFDDYDAMLGADGVDAVIVASPSHLHVEHTLAALEAGKHVIVEKPFALGVDDAERMIEAAKARGLIIAPFQNRRYEPHYRQVLEIIASGRWARCSRSACAGIASRGAGTGRRCGSSGAGPCSTTARTCSTRRWLLLGDASLRSCSTRTGGSRWAMRDEHMKLVLRAQGHPTIDIEYTNSVRVRAGPLACHGYGGRLWRTPDPPRVADVDWATMPARELCDEGPAEGAGTRRRTSRG